MVYRQQNAIRIDINTHVNITVWQSLGQSYSSMSADQGREGERAEFVAHSTVELVLKLHPEERDKVKYNLPEV